MPRFLVTSPLTPNSEMVLPAEVAHQVSRVLRLRPGQGVSLVTGEGAEYPAELREFSGKQVTAWVGEARWPETELAHGLHVALAALKGEKLEWAVQKLTELGVARISLLQTERTVVSAGEERWGNRLERYRRIAREAVEQSGRVRVPELVEPVKLPVFLSAATEAHRFILDPYAAGSLTSTLPTERAAVLGLVGPEGGFTEAEVALAREVGVQGVRMGRRVLRAETVAVAVATLLADWLES